MINYIKKKVFIKKIIIKLYSFLIFFGIDLRKLYSLIFIPKFLLSLIKFKKLKGNIDKIKPILADYISDYVDDIDNIHEDCNINNYIKKLDYGCGIYTIRKK